MSEILKDDTKVNIQLRSEDGTLLWVSSIKEAIQKATSDPLIWKISFSLPNNERVRLVRENNSFVLEQMDIILNRLLQKE